MADDVEDLRKLMRWNIIERHVSNSRFKEVYTDLKLIGRYYYEMQLFVANVDKYNTILRCIWLRKNGADASENHPNSYVLWLLGIAEQRPDMSIPFVFKHE
jgi:hypothetical protein